ncbi:hypothetical protein VCHENC02_5992, partial [Vibrio harveyi]
LKPKEQRLKKSFLLWSV